MSVFDKPGNLDFKLDPGSEDPDRGFLARSGEDQNLPSINPDSPRLEEKDENTKALTGDEEGSPKTTWDGALWLGDAKSRSFENLCQSQVMLRASASSLPGSKGRFHSVSKGAGIGKHMNARGVGRAGKLAHLEVAAEHLGTSSHALLTSPRVLRSPGRKKSPIRWFPRKKTESYLERKIRMLQEKEGNIVSLDETLGAASPHLSRIEREKLAAQAAATEAKDARKGALIEASGCRILKLAGIPCKSAILELQKAEMKASAALAEAENLGVILQHGPGEREPASEAVTASLDTAFDVDKEVAAAIKVALQEILRSPARNNERERDSQFDMAEFSLEADSQSDPEIKENFEEQTPHNDLSSDRFRCKNQEKSSVQHSLVSLMVSRISDLSVEHHTALGSIVATRGLSALLKEQNLEQELNERTADSLDSKPLDDRCSPKNSSDLGSILVKHVSRLQREVQASKEANRNLQSVVEKKSGGRLQRGAQVDSLDQILVKHVSKLEKEKLAAQATRRTPPKIKVMSGAEQCGGERKKLSEVTNTPYNTPDLGSILVKHVSMLEKAKQAVTRMQSSVHTQDANIDRVQVVEAQGLNMLGAKEELSDVGIIAGEMVCTYNAPNELLSAKRKENRQSDFNENSDLGSNLVKHVSRLEKEKRVALALQDVSKTSGRKVENSKQSGEAGLGEILVKRLSKLEIEKARLSNSGIITTIEPTEEGDMNREKELKKEENSFSYQISGDRVMASEDMKIGSEAKSVETSWQRAKAHKLRQTESTWGGLALHDALPSAKSTSGLSNKGKTFNESLPKLKSLGEKQMEDAWGGLSLGNTLKRHVSKLEKEQAAWRLAEEEARQRQNLQN